MSISYIGFSTCYWMPYHGWLLCWMVVTNYCSLDWFRGFYLDQVNTLNSLFRNGYWLKVACEID